MTPTPDSPATVVADSFLTLHYRLAGLDGNAYQEYVSTFELSPATLQMGSGQLAEPLENCLLGMPAGTRQVFDLSADEAFGSHNPRLVERIARSALPAETELKAGSLIEFADSGGGAFAGYLRELSATSALFDFNHPLAGVPVRFEVEIIAIM